MVPDTVLGAKDTEMLKMQSFFSCYDEEGKQVLQNKMQDYRAPRRE